jgi:hypothetical protein
MQDSSTVTALAIRFSNRLTEGPGDIDNATSHGGSMHDARSGGAACYQKDFWTTRSESAGLPILTRTLASYASGTLDAANFPYSDDTVHEGLS